MEKNTQPIHFLWIIRFLVVIIFILSLFAGYYLTKFQELEKRYNRLNIRYLELQEN